MFGSAARRTDFDPEKSDADFLVEFEPDSRLRPFHQYFYLFDALYVNILGRLTLAKKVEPRYRRSRMGPCLVCEHRADLLLIDAGEPLDKFLDRGSAGEVFVERGQWNSRTGEDPRAADLARRPLHGRACVPVLHFSRLRHSGHIRSRDHNQSTPRPVSDAAAIAVSSWSRALTVMVGWKRGWVDMGGSWGARNGRNAGIRGT